MKFIVYHSKDLDGKASGSIGAMYFRNDNLKLIPYHYDEPIDIEQFRNQDVLMADVTVSLEQTLEIARIAKSFTLVDHHVSFFDKFLEYINTNTTDALNITDFTGLIKNYTFSGKINMEYYYSEKLSACEIMLQLYRVGNEFTEKNIRILGQYDTWRNTDEKRFTTDINWNVVMEHQFGFRLADTITEVQNFLMFIPTQHINSGFNILKYQSQINSIAMQRAFEFQLNGLNIIACEGVQFNSTSFQSIYNPEFHDAMMPFNYDGQQKIWNFSLYTTKPEVDILSIAKQFNGGGHKQACGFQLPFDQVRMADDGIQFWDAFITLDLEALPKGFDKEKLMQSLQEMDKPPIFIEKAPSGTIEKIVMERDTYQPPTDEEKIPPPPPTEKEIIAGLTDTDDLDNIGTVSEIGIIAKNNVDNTTKTTNTKKHNNGSKK